MTTMQIMNSLYNCKIDELVILCVKENLDHYGSKDDLIIRLTEKYENKNKEKN